MVHDSDTRAIDAVVIEIRDKDSKAASLLREVASSHSEFVEWHEN